MKMKATMMITNLNIIVTTKNHPRDRGHGSRNRDGKLELRHQIHLATKNLVLSRLGHSTS